MEFLQVLVLNTGHVTLADMQRLTGRSEDEPHSLGAANDACGAWVYAPAEESLPSVSADGYSPSMLKALRFARNIGASHVRFDRDGPLLERAELDVHDW